MIFAPICVITLNRIKHLKCLIESLQNNKYAQNTELFISVDYPPSDKYWEGYNQVVDYLKGKITGFRGVNIYYQTQNLGPGNNFEYIINKAKNKYDCWIFTEDDNEMSPNFIEYMDCMLDKYRDDMNVYAICGCKNKKLRINDESYGYCRRFSSYGYAMWQNRYDKMRDSITDVLLDPKNYSVKSIANFYLQSPPECCSYIKRVLTGQNKMDWTNDGRIIPVDLMQGIYINLSNLKCIFPQVAKSRTNGNDGSGINMPQASIPIVKLDRSTTFEIDDNSIPKLYKWDDSSLLEKIKDLIKYLIFILCKKDRKKAIKIIHGS